jgi:hypothetical protein
MEISLNEVKETLQKLITDEISRESGNSWAYRLMEEAEANSLTYNPKKSRPVIWDSIMFVMGLNIETQPGVYLHNKDDIQAFLDEIS